MGKIHEETMRKYMQLPGEIAECGVNHGSSSKIMVRVAAEFQRRIWFFDSFRGMPHSSVKSDLLRYPQGRFDNASADAVLKIVGGYSKANIVVGWLPQALSGLELRFSFVFLDLDHYEGTIQTLRMLWPMILLGGAILCDDFFEDKRDLATQAVREFIDVTGNIKHVRVDEDQILLEKLC